jgi:hypothetical protein
VGEKKRLLWRKNDLLDSMESQCGQRILLAGGSFSEADLTLEFEPGLENSRSDSSSVDIDSAMFTPM